MADARLGRLFVFEGPDDVGKTTLAEMLSEYLLSEGLPNQVLSFPGREPGTVSELIYRLYHDSASLGVNEIKALSMQVMVTAAHIEVIETRIKPLLRSGVDVVLDRFWWSTWVYATLEGVSEQARDLMLELEMQSWGSVRPELVFLVLRSEPLLQQVAHHQWQEKVRLYIELANLQEVNQSVLIVRTEKNPTEALQIIVSRLKLDNAPVKKAE